jgi:tetratricopeptide (TPR) repeat protein
MAASKDEARDFFISYEHTDREWAEWIAWQLEEAGCSVVLQAWDFRPGQGFIAQIDAAATRCRRTAAVLSPDYFESPYCSAEWAAALAQDPDGRKGRLLPVRVRDCDVQGLLGAIAYIDLVDLDEAAARERLLAGISCKRAKPTKPPAYPRRAVAEEPAYPGGLPPIFGVPHRRNPNFTGREELLAALHEALASGAPAALTQETYAVHGLGGVGKTQLAVEYAYRYASEYDLVWWVRSEEPAERVSDYAALAQALGLKEAGEADQRAAVAAVRGWLEHHGGWLLAFDNVPAPDDVAELLPRGGDGHVIITSRNPNWTGVARPLEVRTFPRPESVRFLLDRTGSEDEAAADALAEALGDLPLALEQAGAYVEETGTTLADYLDLVRKREAEMLARGGASRDYPLTVATTWTISMEAAKKACAAAEDLLCLCAYLAPDDIPLDLLSENAEKLPDGLRKAVKDRVRFDEAVAALRRYSLCRVECEARALSVHRLVQAVARGRLDEAGEGTWAAAAVRIVSAAFPFDSGDVRTWETCGRLLPHALASASHAEGLAVAPDETGRALNQAGGYLSGRARLAEAKACYERAIAIGEKTLGKVHPTVAIRVNNLGLVLQALGDLAEAKACYERAIAIDEKAYGKDHPDVATDVNNLGGVLRALGDPEGAKACFERAIAIDEKAYGKDHLTVAIRTNNLGNVLQDLGDLAGAKACFERAIAIDEKAYGKDHPEVATDVNNLGGVFRALGVPEEAKACFERALAIDEKAYGKDHPTVATIINNLGNVLQDLGDLAGAKACYERAIAIDEKAYGKDHPEVATDVNNLGSVLRALGDLAGARRCVDRAYRISLAFRGEDHLTTQLYRKNLESVGGKA